MNNNYYKNHNLLDFITFKGITIKKSKITHNQTTIQQNIKNKIIKIVVYNEFKNFICNSVCYKYISSVYNKIKY